MTIATRELLPWIGGKFVDVEGDRLPVLDPSDGSRIAAAPRCGPTVVDEAVRAASAAFQSWSRTTPRERAERLDAIAAVVERHGDELFALESRQAGKPITAALSEQAIVADNWRFFAAACRTPLAPAAGEYSPDHTSFVRREPLGVAALIAPWNYPLHMATWKLGPALAGGNTCVIKPSELTPWSLLRLLELVGDVLPPGVVNVVTGDGVGTGAALVSHPAIAAVSVTGGVGTGRAVARAAARSLARVHLELGGKAPVVVLDDADVIPAAPIIAAAAFVNAGQDCTAACRIIATPGVYDKLAEALAAAAADWSPGPTTDPATKLGPVISERHRRRVLDAVARATDQGAEVITGDGTVSGPGFYVSPTIIVGARQDSDLVQHEVFGPVISIQRAADTTQALTWANDVSYGLSASVWTSDLTQAMRATRELGFGTVWVNDHMPVVSEMPFGGLRGSGYGKDMSLEAVAHYTESKHIMIRI